MLIRVKVKVKNDHRSLTEDFETDALVLGLDDPQLKGWVEQVLQAFGQPVDTVTIKTSMDI
jgi:hypothetical protein